MKKDLRQFPIPYGRLTTTGNSGRKALNQGSGNDNRLSDCDILIRESIQNSSDSAMDDDGSTHIKFRALNLTPELNDIYKEELGINNDLKPILKTDNYDIQDSINLNNVLFIEDYKTWGLTESEKNITNKRLTRFYKFFSGDGTNDESSDLGGSYGYGKTAYTDNSLIRTIIIYSCSKEDDGSYITKLKGITKSAPYFDKGKQYSGYIYHGNEMHVNYEDFDFDITPFRNNEADRIAEKLGFKKRDRSDDGTGTSILIVGLENNSDEFFKEVKESVEKYWWKKIVDNELCVDIIDKNGEVLTPDPESNSYLEPFIFCYKLLKKTNQNTDPDIKVQIKQYKNDSKLGFPVGRIVLRELSSGSQESINSNSILVNSIALFRQSGMIIEYKKCPSQVNNIFTVGVFEAHKNLNRLLRSAEPANHWGWIENSKRLKDLKEYIKLNITLEDAQKLIKNIYRKVKDSNREFQLTLTPESKITSSNFRNLDVVLTKFFGKGTKTGTSGGGSPRNIRIHHKKPTSFTDLETNKTFYKCPVDVYLDQEGKREISLVCLTHKININGDDNAQTVIDTFESELEETDAKLSKEIDGKKYYEISKIISSFVFKTKSIDNSYHSYTSADYSEIEVEN